MNVGAQGRSLELYFIDGSPSGMLTAEVFNWTGHVLMVPRTRISEALSRKEACYTGIYILLGEKEGKAHAYVGEGEDISQRIRSHANSKDWWQTAVLVTSAANNLNKAHVKYLEARLIEEALAADSVSLNNGTAPAPPSLSEAARANMEVFLDYLLMVLPAVRVDLFLSNRRPAKTSLKNVEQQTSPVFELFTPKHRLKATAILESGEFVVKSGSMARSKWFGRGTEHTGYSQLHAKLIRNGILVEKDGHCVFTESYAFTSPSAAAAVINGRPANGTKEWKIQGSSTTYKAWEARRLATQTGLAN